MGKLLDNRFSNIAASFINSTTADSYQPKNYSLLQQKINSEWAYATDKFDIQEELIRGSKQFSSVQVRLTHVVNKPSTSSSGNSILGDDIKGIIFSNIDHPYGLGYMYQFDGNFWVITFSDTYHYPTASASIRRCNNVLKWIDEDGLILEEPCIIDYLINRDRIQYDDMNLAAGDIKITAQNNSNTAKIKMNQRFIFDGQVFKIQRVNSYLREKTTVKSSAPLISFSLYKDQEAADDDFVNNIANTSQYQYNLVINQTTFSNVVGTTGTLTATVKLNDAIVTKPLTWSSSDDTIVSIDALGNYTMLANGTVIITCCLTDNNLVSNSINVSVNTIPVTTSEIQIAPNTTEVFSSDDPTIYTCYKYSNGVKQSDTFTFIGSGVPNTNNNYYKLTTINGNSFSLQGNQVYKSGNLTINCTDKLDSSIKTISIQLKDAF
jgi:hypothetical protein